MMMGMVVSRAVPGGPMVCRDGLRGLVVICQAGLECGIQYPLVLALCLKGMQPGPQIIILPLQACSSNAEQACRWYTHFSLATAMRRCP